MSSISDPLEEAIILNPLSEQIESRNENERLLELDRDIDEYKQQIDVIKKKGDNIEPRTISTLKRQIIKVFTIIMRISLVIGALILITLILARIR